MYNHPKVKGTVTFTHGEGFGRPLLEESFSGKPILARFSQGQDFLDKNYVVELPHEMTKVSQRANFKRLCNEESSWSTSKL